MTRLLVLANLGAEEGEAWREAARTPRVAAARALFGALFGEGAELVAEDGVRRASPHAEPAFPWCAAADAPTGAGAARPSTTATATDDAPAAADASDDAPGGIAWLGDEAARETLARLGARWRGAPPATAMALHDKAFAAPASGPAVAPRITCYAAEALAPGAPRSATLSDVQARIDAWPAWMRAHACLKPRLGTSGRGRLHLRGGRVADAAPRAALERALDRLAARGGAVLEPWLERTVDLSVAFHAGARGAGGGALALLGSLRAITSASGAPRGHRGEIDARGRVFSGTSWDDAARGAAAELVAAASAAGYGGPCAVDAFAYLDRGGAAPVERLRPVVELNARFTTGIAALGALRRSRVAIRHALGLAPGERVAFVVASCAPEGGWHEHVAAMRARGSAPALVPVPTCAEAGSADAAIVAAREAAALDELCAAL
ncbi:MAG: hypothetical protein R3E88_09045 [Myxococcota bacterium]